MVFHRTRKKKIKPLYKQKGDLLHCSNYKGIKLLGHCIKLWEWIIEVRLREVVTIKDRQYGFKKRKVNGATYVLLHGALGGDAGTSERLHMVF